jgi:ParB family chromosome partitioning protein
MHRKALGKGLEALFSQSSDAGSDEDGVSTLRIISIPVRDIIPNKQQPRKTFDASAMEELKTSIAENGILEPPVVRRKGELFELIAGERRLRAAKELNFETIDVILMEVGSEEKMLVLSLIENIQREDLNAIDEANAYQHIMGAMELTQEQLSSVVGKNRSTIANTLRLLTLSNPVQDMVVDGSLAPGSARALIPVENEMLQVTLARKIAGQSLSTRKAEELVKQALSEHARKSTAFPQLPPDIEHQRLELQRLLGTEVRIKGSDSKGKIEIQYYTRDDFSRILESIRGDGAI